MHRLAEAMCLLFLLGVTTHSIKSMTNMREIIEAGGYAHVQVSFLLNF